MRLGEEGYAAGRVGQSHMWDYRVPLVELRSPISGTRYKILIFCTKDADYEPCVNIFGVRRVKSILNENYFLAPPGDGVYFSMRQTA